MCLQSNKTCKFYRNPFIKSRSFTPIWHLFFLLLSLYLVIFINGSFLQEWKYTIYKCVKFFFPMAVYFGHLLISIVIKEKGFGKKRIWREGSGRRWAHLSWVLGTCWASVAGVWGTYGWRALPPALSCRDVFSCLGPHSSSPKCPHAVLTWRVLELGSCSAVTLMTDFGYKGTPWKTPS